MRAVQETGPILRLNNLHYNLDKIRLGEEWRRQLETPQQCFEASNVFIRANLYTMDPTEALLYLGQIVAYNKRNWKSLYHYFKKDGRPYQMMTKVKSGSVVKGNDVQGIGLDCVAVWEWELGSDGINVDRYRGFPTSGGQKKCMKDSLEYWGWRLGIATSGRISGGDRNVSHQRINSEAVVHHCDTHCQPFHTWNMKGALTMPISSRFMRWWDQVVRWEVE